MHDIYRELLRRSYEDVAAVQGDLGENGVGMQSVDEAALLLFRYRVAELQASDGLPQTSEWGVA